MNPSEAKNDLSPATERVDLVVRGQRIRLHVPAGETWRTRTLFELHIYGGIPLRVLRNPPVVLDLGAGVGLFAAYAKLFYQPNAIIHCFESYSPHFALLRQNAALFPDIHIHSLHIEEEAQDVPPSQHSTDSTELPSIRAMVSESVNPVTVPAYHLSAVWKELVSAEVDMLKVNASIEVADLECLKQHLKGVRVVLAEFRDDVDRWRIDALLPYHQVFGLSMHEPYHGVAKYVRSDLLPHLPGTV